MMTIGDDRGWQYWAGIHGLPLPMFCQHHTALFLPWHRAYLYFAELALKQAGGDPGVSFPWWDWSVTRGIPVAYEAAEVDGQPNPLAGTEINALALEQARRAGLPEEITQTFRDPGAPGVRPLPTPQAVSRLLEFGDFLDFQTQLEQFHDDVHVWVGGTMAEIPLAAYDPVFWAHHAMVDRIWRLWQLRHPTAGVPAELLDEALPPFNITVRQTLSVTALGYDYAAFSSRSTDGRPV
jgi:tyrosinase